jgi:phage/plasmid-associated DNA primase
MEGRGVEGLLDVLEMGSLPAAVSGERYHVVIKHLLAEGFSKNFLTSVPGFYLDDSSHLMLAGAEGILIPVYSVDRKIQAFQIRRDKVEDGQPRYTWLSCGWHDKYGDVVGVGSGAPAAVLMPEAEWLGGAIITEGAVKGVSLRNVHPTDATISLAGVSLTSAALDALASLPSTPQRISLVFDADAWRKEQVFSALARMVIALQGSYPKASLEVVSWDEAHGKGIDDFLTNTKTPKTWADTVRICPQGIIAAHKAMQEKRPLHLFGTTEETMQAISCGLPAVCVPNFEAEGEALEKLSLRVEKAEAFDVYLYSPNVPTPSLISLARELVSREREVNLTVRSLASGAFVQPPEIPEYAEAFADVARPLFLWEAQRVAGARFGRDVSEVVGAVRHASQGRDAISIGQAISVMKAANPSLLCDELLAAVKKELKPVQPAQNQIADWFYAKRRDIAYDPRSTRWFLYDHDQAWRPVDRERIYREIRDFASPLCAKFERSFIEGAAEQVKWYRTNSEWNTNRNLIPLQNGVLDLTHTEGDLAKLSLKDFDPEDRLTWRLPFAFDPKADCPKIKAWLRRATSIKLAEGQLRESEEFQQKIRAFIAATLRGMGESLQMFLEVVGLPGTGKGTLIRLIEAFMGEQNLFVTQLQRLEENRFESAGVVGRRLLVVTDSDNYRGSCEVTRALTGGDRISTEEKGKQRDAEGYRPNLMVLIAANNHIQFQESDAMERRRVSVRFDQMVAPHEQNPNLDAELQAELPGLLNWVLTMSEDEIRKALKVDGDDSKLTRLRTLEDRAIGQFVRECLVVEEGVRTKIGDAVEMRLDGGGVAFQDSDKFLYPAFREFYRNSYGSSVIVSSSRFQKDLASFVHSALRIDPSLIFKEEKRRRDGFHWCGIAIRNGEDDSRPNPFEISPTVGDPSLLKKGGDKEPTPPNGGGNGGGGGGKPTTTTTALPPAPMPPPQATFWADDTLRSLLTADVDGVAWFEPTEDQKEFVKSIARVEGLCKRVWDKKSVRLAAESRGDDPAFVGWVWMRHRAEFARKHYPSAVAHILPSMTQRTRYDVEDVY